MHPLLTLGAALLVFALIFALTHIAAAVKPRRTPVLHPLVLELAQLINPFDQAIHARIVASGHPTMEVAEAPLKDKLRRVEAEISQLRDDRVGLASARNDARDAFAGSESLSQDSPEFEAANEAQRALGECDDRLADLQAVQVATLRMLGRDTPDARNRDRETAGDPTDPRSDGRWRSGVLAQADQEFRARLGRLASSKERVNMALGEVASRDALVDDVTGTTNMRRGAFGGILPQIRRRLSVLDLIPTGTMDANTFPYTKEGGSFATAGETAEGDTKPQAGITLTDDEAIAATIAHWSKVRKQALSDVPALQSIIDGRLRYGVLRRLEGQILNGDGTGANMRGILQTTGLGAVTFTSGDVVVEQILRGITTVLLAEAEATGIVLNPLDWETALLTKASGSGEYVGGGPFQVTAQQLWGVPLVPSPVVPQGTALVGDFAIGAQLLIREGVSVLMSDSDQDDFINNRITLLAEMRAALPVFRPAAFATVALD